MFMALLPEYRNTKLYIECMDFICLPWQKDWNLSVTPQPKSCHTKI